MDVEVCYAERVAATRVVVSLEVGATVGSAIERSGIVPRLALELGLLDLAIYGRRVTLATVVTAGDRVELLRPLVVDPKEARRRRALKKSKGSAT